MISGYDSYRYYLALKLHFNNPKFDVFETPKTRASYETYLRRNDFGLFEQIAHKYKTDKEVINFFVSNFAYNNDNVVYDNQIAEDNYYKWNQVKHRITKQFSDDISKIISVAEKDNLKKSDLFDFTFGTIPVILSLYLGNHIRIESLRIIDDYFNIIDTWLNADFHIWYKEILRIKKSKRFIKYDKEKIRKIIDSFNDDLKHLDL